MKQTVFVCQGRTCRKDAATKVLEAFKANPIPEIEIISAGCLGECGNGPMVIILPDKICYSRVCLSQVPLIIEQHLRGKVTVFSMLYPYFSHK